MQFDLDGIRRSWPSIGRVEFWVDPDPNSQLVLMMFLAFLAREGLRCDKVFLVHGSAPWGAVAHDDPTVFVPKPVQIDEDQIAIANAVWSAYCASSPEAWASLLDEDVSVFPFLVRTIHRMLRDLPDARTGLGETERFVLSVIGPGGKTVTDVIAAFSETSARFLDIFQVAGLLDALAQGPAPLIVGLEEEVPRRLDFADQQMWEKYCNSSLKLTPLASDILNGAHDFVAEHGINRWWGGTHLTRARRWRWVSGASDCPVPRRLEQVGHVARMRCQANDGLTAAASEIGLLVQPQCGRDEGIGIVEEVVERSEMREFVQFRGHELAVLDGKTLCTGIGGDQDRMGGDDDLGFRPFLHPPHRAQEFELPLR